MAVVLALVLAALAVAVAALIQRRRHPDAPTQSRWQVPGQLDRADFARPEVPWLVAVFSSLSCDACARVVAAAKVLDSDSVAVDEIEYSRRTSVHRRYHVEAVPLVVIADADGAVRASFVGPVAATDLWAALAELRAAH